MTDPTNLGTIWVTGQRRAPGGSFPSGGGGGSGDPEGDHQAELDADPDHTPPYSFNPCGNPAGRREWNTDAAAAQTVKDLEEFAGSEPATGGRGFNEREYGAALWERADGTVIRGPMRHSEQTFAEAAAAAATGGTGKPTVDIDWTPPEPDLVPIGSVHSHGVGGTLPSGHRDFLQSDVGHLFGIAAQRNYLLGPGKGAEARIYIASKTFGQYETPGSTKVNVYDETNIDAAIGGDEGPEVNPDGQPCGAP